MTAHPPGPSWHRIPAVGIALLALFVAATGLAQEAAAVVPTWTLERSINGMTDEETLAVSARASDKDVAVTLRVECATKQPGRSPSTQFQYLKLSFLLSTPRKSSKRAPDFDFLARPNPGHVVPGCNGPDGGFPCLLYGGIVTSYDDDARIFLRFGKNKALAFAFYESSAFDVYTLEGVSRKKNLLGIVPTHDVRKELQGFWKDFFSNDTLTIQLDKSDSELAYPIFDLTGFETVAAPLFEKCPKMRPNN